MSCIVLSYLSAAHIAACSHLTRTERLKSSSLDIRCIQERNSCVPVTGAAVFYFYNYRSRSEFWDFVAHYIDPVLFQLSLDQYFSMFAMFTIIQPPASVAIAMLGETKQPAKSENRLIYSFAGSKQK